MAADNFYTILLFDIDEGKLDKMTHQELMRDYWYYYCTLENRFLATSTYVEIHKDNFSTFSNEYALLLQACGAELDNFFKVYCGFNSYDRKNINDYSASILLSYPDIVDQKVEIKDRDIELQPFLGWSTAAPAKSLSWWQAFDTIKHNRASNKTLANQENVLNMLAALYILEMKYFSIVAKKDSNGKLLEPDVPDTASKLFYMKNWNNSWSPFSNIFIVKES